MKLRGIQPDRPPDFAPRGGVSLQQAGRLNELKDRARVGGMSYAHFVELIRRVGLVAAEDDIEGRLDELEQLIDLELNQTGGPR
jgi:hypothetical protein